MKDYKEAIESIMKDTTSKVIEHAINAYRQGHEDGHKEKLANAMIYDHEEAENKAYNRGLNEAWEAAKKIHDGQIPYDVFGLDKTGNGYSYASPLNWGETITAQEAIVKIKEYEDKQKQDAEIKVGDEIVCEDAHVVITYISPINEWNGFLLNSCECGERGQGYTGMYGFKGWEKTGRHFDQIAEVLAEMRGAENDE